MRWHSGLFVVMALATACITIVLPAFAGATMHDFFNLLTILLLFPLEQGTHYLERAATWLSSHLVGAQGMEFEGPVKAITAPPADAARIGRPVCTTSRCPEESVSASGSAAAFRTHGE